MEEEKWKPVEGYEDLYEVSNLGRVKSLDRYGPHNKGGRRVIKGRVLKPWKQRNGYEYVSISRDGCLRCFSVHRLVAQAFVENSDPEHFTIINHKDEDKTNNVWTNLEWCDYAFNNSYGTRTAKASEKRSKPVCGYTNQAEVVIRFKSATEAERYGFNQGAIAACCRGREKCHRNLFWCYEEDEDKIVPQPWPTHSGALKRPVEAYNDDGVVLYSFESAAEAGRNGFVFSGVSACCRGKRNFHKNLHWRFAE